MSSYARRQGRPDPRTLERDHDHPLSPQQWAALLLAVFPLHYRLLPLADAPTDAAPGTPGKVAVMAQRVALGRCPFHPFDAAGDVTRPPTPPQREDQEPHPPGRGRGGRTPGVTRCKLRWLARLWVPAERRYRHLGLYERREDAVAALEVARRG